MKIMQIIKPVGMGGVERIVCSLNNYIKQKGSESIVLINKSKYSEFISHFSIEETESIISYKDNDYFSMIFDLKAKIEEINPDIIHTHARKECAIVSLINKRIPHIRTQHMAESPKIKVTSFEKMLLKNRVDIWAATSKTLARDYLSDKNYINNNKILPVYNGVKDSYKPKTKFDYNNKYCIIARLTKQKGIDLLINQIKKINKSKINFSIDLFGEGPELENIEKMILQNNLENVILYKGATNNPALIAKNYDVLLMPSRHEGLPLTMLESMAVGTPVAIHNVGCVEEIIQPSINGWIIDNNYTWNDFLTNIQEDYERISKNAIKTFKDNFSEDKMCDSYFRIYEELSK